MNNGCTRYWIQWAVARTRPDRDSNMSSGGMASKIRTLASTASVPPATCQPARYGQEGSVASAAEQAMSAAR